MDKLSKYLDKNEISDVISRLKNKISDLEKVLAYTESSCKKEVENIMTTIAQLRGRLDVLNELMQIIEMSEKEEDKEQDKED